MAAGFIPLPEPELVDPPACACKGLAPQMREHTRNHCSQLRTAELNILALCIQENRDPTPEEFEELREVL